jgi:hypothetical protein
MLDAFIGLSELGIEKHKEAFAIPHYSALPLDFP